MAPYASGSMVWQVNEPWPNCDCTNLVDYFGNPKMAYYWIKAAFSDSDVSLRYKSLIAGERLEAEVVLNGDATPCDEKCEVSVYSIDGRRLMTESISLKDLPYNLSVGVSGESLVFVRVVHQSIRKDYFFSTAKSEHFKAMRDAARAELSLKVSEPRVDGELSYYEAEVRNTGGTPAYFVNVRDRNLGYAILADDQYFTLLAGEARTVKMTVRERTGLFFDKPIEKPEFILSALNAR
jgi:beta-mannosidase